MPDAPRQGPSNGRKPAQGRRKPPPDATGEERRFLNGQLKSGSRVRLVLKDGTRSEGTVCGFDERQIEIDGNGRLPVVLTKASIRYIEEV